jgi:acetyltransferase-like isoleucine patch superfamily enzyme
MDLNERLVRNWQGVLSRLRITIFRLLGMKIGRRCWIQGIEWPLRMRGITVGDRAMLERGITLLATHASSRIVIGVSAYLNRHTFVDATELVEIGDEAMIGPRCYLTDHDHSFNATDAAGALPLISAPTRIGAKCWLGANVTVLKGVTIGEGAVIGAGSVVTRDIPPRSVAVGNPARVIKTLDAASLIA